MLAFLLLFGHWIIATIVAIRVIYRRLAVGTSLAWLFILFFLPYVGIVAYLLFGEWNLGKQRKRRNAEINQLYQDFITKNLSYLQENQGQLNGRLAHISQVAALKTNFYTQKHNDMELLAGADKIFDAMINDIQQAKKTCLLEFYIIEPKGKVEELLNILCMVASQGVRCQILADGVGSRSFFKSLWPKKLQDAGIQVENSLSVGLIKTFLKRMDLRNHRKILVIDECIGYTGSFNLVDPQFFKTGAGVGKWIDVMVRCQGTIVHFLSAIFYRDAAVESQKNMTLTIENFNNIVDEFVKTDLTGEISAQVIPSGPDQDKATIIETFVSAFYTAESKIIITTPYFVPDDSILMALMNAAHRGVEVVIIVPQKVDSILVRYASHSFYEDLLSAGVKIFAFDGGLLHSKTVNIDDEFCFVGTVNMDIRSFYLNLEVTLAIYNSEFTHSLYALQKNYLKSSKEITALVWRQRSTAKRFMENTIRLTSPFL